VGKVPRLNQDAGGRTVIRPLSLTKNSTRATQPRADIAPSGGAGVATRASTETPTRPLLSLTRPAAHKSANPDSRPPHGSTRLDVMYRQAKRSAARSEPVPCTMAFSVAHETPGLIARQL